MGEVRVEIDLVQFKKWFTEPYKPLNIGNPHYYERKRNLIENKDFEILIKDKLQNLEDHMQAVKLGMYSYMPNNPDAACRYETDETTMLLVDNLHQEELAFAMTYHHETRADSKKYGVVYNLTDRLLDIMAFLDGINLTESYKKEAEAILYCTPVGRLGLFSQSWLSPALNSIWENADNETSLLPLSEHVIFGDILADLLSALNNMSECHGRSMDYITSLVPVRRQDVKLRTLFLNFANYCLEELLRTINSNTIKITSLSHSKLIGLVSNPEEAPRVIFTCQGSQIVLDPLVVDVNSNEDILNVIIKGGLC